MIQEYVINIAYVVASILFIIGLKRLGHPKTARKGNLLSAIGMLVAVVVTLISKEIISFQWIVVGIVLGTVIGAAGARVVAMTAMPEMVAIFNGFGGIASLLVAWGVYLENPSTDGFTLSTLILSVIIGGVTFTGSLMAYGKLSGKVTTKPVLYPGQQIVNSLLFLVLATGSVLLFFPDAISIPVETLFIILISLSALLGILFVLPIGGADMPVVISLLNSYSGLAACTAGFAIQNNVLIVSGALVGASGIVLTQIMCKAMNRSLANVLFSGFGSGTSKKSSGSSEKGEVKSASIEDAFYVLEAAKNVVIIPGYGMAVAQAQHAVQELAELLEENGAEINFGIHPVAGRMPGHMNVLLAEADVPYEQLREMDAINPQMENADVAIVIGANDVVNPAAREDEGSPIYGMPIINVDKARTVFVLKRSMNSGFAGIENPLFYNDNTRMVFGDAKTTVQGLVTEFKELEE